MLYHITHTTLYEYSEPAVSGHNLLHLEPRCHPRQRVLQWDLEIDPPPTTTSRQTDYFGNPVSYFAIHKPHRRLSITARSQIEVTQPASLATDRSMAWDDVVARLRGGREPEVRQAVPFVFESPYVPRDDALADFAASSFAAGRPLLDAVLDLTGRIHRDFRYDSRATTVATPLGDVLARRAGVCQDFAHLQIGCLRAMGLAARYVSGYLVTDVPAGQPQMTGADASHAWVSVFSP
jgi:transglutaminase-like putative cysteine protease